MSQLRQTSNYASCKFKSRQYFHTIGLNNFDGHAFLPEFKLDQIKFFIHKFNQQKKEKELFVFALTEFGCELFLPHYFLNIIKEKYSNYRIIVIGWQGRAFFYKELVDEFWEIAPEHMWLRDTTRAFQHQSKNIKKLEQVLKQRGMVFPSQKFGNFVLESVCANCQHKFGSEKCVACPMCYSMNVKPSMFGNLQKSKKDYVPLQYKNKKIKNWMDDNFPDNLFGIFARNRTTYGRNLPVSFYIELIKIVKDMGYKPVWIGEKQSILPCPDNTVIDFTKYVESNNMQYTLELVSRCVCTFQCWTASTRLAQITNTPFVLVESPDQIYGKGHEGKRIYLFTQDFSKKKLILCNFHKVCENIDEFINICKKSVYEFLTDKNHSDVVGLVDNENYVRSIVQKAELWKTN